MILKINDRIRNRRVDFFDSFEMSLRYDSIASTFGFNGYFNPLNPEHKDLYCIGHYHDATIEHNDELLITGKILTQGFTSSSQRKLVTFSGYSMPGVLEDCEIPVSLYPLESDGLTLREIAEKLLAPFNISMVIDSSVSAEMNAPFAKSVAGEGQTIKGYLTELATQKNVIISHDSRGRVVFTRAHTGRSPILNYGGDGVPCPDMSLSFPGQSMHSEITVMKQADIDGGNAGETTIKNPYVRVGYRPRVITQTSGDDIDTNLVAQRALAAELKNFKLTITIDRWDLNSKIIRPDNIITVLNPEIYLYKRSTWFIEEVHYKGDAQKMTTTLTCVLPEVYNGGIPKYLFEGINLH